MPVARTTVRQDLEAAPGVHGAPITLSRWPLPAPSRQNAWVLPIEGEIVEVTVTQRQPRDFMITFVVDSGATAVLDGEVYGAGQRIEDLFDVFSWLVLQGTPPHLIDASLSVVVPEWETYVATRRHENDLASGIDHRSADSERREALKQAFKQRGDSRSRHRR